MILLLAHQRPDGDVDTYHLKPGRRYHIGRGSGCEVRILDLKLSRKHAAVEYLDGAWRFVDLGSTNGCTVDEILADEPMELGTGATIALGQTVLKVAGLVDPVAPDPVYRREPSEEFAPAETTAPVAETSHAEPLTAIRSATPVVVPADAPPVPLAVEAVSRSSSRMRAAVVVPPSRALEQHATPPMPLPPIEIPSTSPSAAVATISDERPFFITVLGTRVGPLTKVQARELKSRELRGELAPGDLAAYPKA